jgi:O-antigen/teichoic acid export membrane protein
VGRGVIYLYIDFVVTIFSGYVYWLIVSKFGDPSIVGIASSVVSLVFILTAVASIGVSVGIQRAISKNLSIANLDNVKRIINSSFLIVTLGQVGTFLTVFIMREWIYESFRINSTLLIITVILVSTMVIYSLLNAIIIPTLKVRIIAFSAVVAAIIKVIATLVLLASGTEVVGILFGFMLFPVICIIILVRYIRKTLYTGLLEGNLKSQFGYVYDIFVTGFGFWIPTVITTIGSQLGTISVLLSVGSNQAGIFFIASSIVLGVTTIITVLSNMAYPTISSMTDGRKRASWKLIKVSLLLTTPLSIIISFYSNDILSLFGNEYQKGSDILIILLFSIIPTSIFTGIGVLVYSYGFNKLFLSIGLFTSMPRVLLYFLLVPIFGGNGAALAYTIGTVGGFFCSLIICRQVQMKLLWKPIILISLVPILISIVFKMIHFNDILSIFFIMILSYVTFIKLRIIEDEDVAVISEFLPEPLEKNILKLINIIKGRKS